MLQEASPWVGIMDCRCLGRLQRNRNVVENRFWRWFRLANQKDVQASLQSETRPRWFVDVSQNSLAGTAGPVVPTVCHSSNICSFEFDEVLGSHDCVFIF